MHRLFTGQGVITSAVAAMPRRQRERTRAAIAFFTSDHLKLQGGDELVVNAHKKVVSKGGTNPNLLLDLHRAGVLIYSEPNLHAKVVEQGGHVAIGSANSSGKSLELVEAMWVSDDPQLLQATSSWLKSLIVEDTRLSKADLKKLAKLYRPATGGGPELTGAPRSKASKPRPRPKTVWVWQPRAPQRSKVPAAPTTQQGSAPATTSMEVIENSDQANTRQGEGWVRLTPRGNWLQSPRIVVHEQHPQDADFTVCSYQPGVKSVRAPRWVLDAYRNSATNGSTRFSGQQARDLLDLFE